MIRKQIFISLIVAILTVGAAFAQNFDQKRLTVTGSVEMRVTADHASFSFSVKGTGANLSQAVARARQKIDLIAAVLHDTGLPENNLRLSHFYSGENFQNRAFFSSSQDYHAKISAVVEIDSLELLEQAIMAVSEQMPEKLSAVKFSLRNFEQYKIDVLTQAAAKAREKAEILAKELKATLGEVLFIEERPVSRGYHPNPFNSVSRPETPIDSGSSGSSFFPQDISLSASVKVIIALKE